MNLLFLHLKDFQGVFWELIQLPLMVLVAAVAVERQLLELLVVTFLLKVMEVQVHI
tara:strand:- start:215 stop:382 length:168 start_codon:yes stop_codon:yes gene_type:complete